MWPALLAWSHHRSGHPPWSQDAHLDFADKLGFVYPGPEATKVPVPPKQRAHMWQEVMRTLPLDNPAHTFDAEQFRATAKPWWKIW